MKFKKRNYSSLVNTLIEEATKANLEVRYLKSLPYDDGYPFFMLQSKSRTTKYNVVITSGFHGDEAYTIDSLIHALGDLDTALFNFYIFPVMNPWGYVHHSRMNGEKKGSNWRVGKRDTIEIALMFRHLPSKIDLLVDIHGDADQYEAYAYERKLPGKESLARLALKDVENYFDIVSYKRVYKEPCKEGVVTSGEEDTLEEYLFTKRGVPYSITLEIPGKSVGTNRVAGGARLILATLNNFERVRQTKKGVKNDERPRI